MRSEPGPVLAITAGIHGGEYVPLVAVRQFVRGLDPARMRGTVVACLMSSPAAFWQRSAFVNPLDGQNLNRSFPGDPAGGPTARLAAWLRENLIARADFYIDCHCGDLPEALDPFAGLSPEPDGTVSEQGRALADCFDVSRIVVSRTHGDTLAAAGAAGVPAVLVEVGGQGQWSQAEADIQRDGLRRVAALAGILPDRARPGRACRCSRTRPTCSASARVCGSPRSPSARQWNREPGWAAWKTRSETRSRTSWPRRPASWSTG